MFQVDLYNLQFLQLIKLTNADANKRLVEKVDKASDISIVSRRDFLNKQDVKNIEKATPLLQTGYHSDDAKSVDIFVQRLQNQQHNCILLYKRVGTVDLGMEEQEFFLVIQSQHQRQLYRQYASRIVCVDSTHGTNAYDYKLITMMVCDDWGQGKRLTFVNLRCE